MEKLPMCRICMVQNVRMFIVVNRNIHELYEKLTNIPFVTEDRRPILACFICFTKLKQCCQLRSKCLKAEEWFAQMNKDYEANPIVNKDHFKCLGGFIRSPIENISVGDVAKTERITFKEELPAVSEGLDNTIEQEHQRYEAADDVTSISVLSRSAEQNPAVPAVDVMEMDLNIKSEVEEEQEEEVSMMKRKTRKTKMYGPSAKASSGAVSAASKRRKGVRPVAVVHA